MPVRSVTLRVLGDDKGAIAALDNVERRLHLLTDREWTIKLGIVGTDAVVAKLAGIKTRLDNLTGRVWNIQVETNADDAAAKFTDLANAEDAAATAADNVATAEEAAAKATGNAADKAASAARSYLALAAAQRLVAITAGAPERIALPPGVGPIPYGGTAEGDMAFTAEVLNVVRNGSEQDIARVLSTVNRLAITGAEQGAAEAVTDAGKVAGRIPGRGKGGGGGGGGGGGFGLFTTQVPIFGGFLPGILGTVGGMHLLIDSIIEVAAVVIPATIALAAFGIAGEAAARGIYGNFQNANTAIDAVGGHLPALTGGFAAIQNAVKPQVFTLFGEGLSLLNNKTGEFRTLATGAGNALIQFVNRGVTALENSGLTGFASKAVQDLSLLFHIIGNIGGIIGNLLRGVPGVADVLFTALDKITGALEAFTGSGIVQGIERVVLGLHGAAIWGGLAATGFMALIPLAARLVNAMRGVGEASALAGLDSGAGFFAKFKAGAQDLTSVLPGVAQAAGGAAQATGALAEKSAAAGEAEKAAAAAGDATAAAEDGAAASSVGLLGMLGKLGALAASPWTWAVIGVGLLAGLVFAFGQLRNSTQQWIEQEQGMVDNSSVFNKMNSLHQAIFQTQQKLIPQTRNYGHELAVVGSDIGSGLNPNLQKYVGNINDLSGAQQGFISEQTRLSALFSTLGARFGMTQQQVEQTTIAMTGSQKAASQLWNSYLKGRMTLSQLVNEYYSYILATTGMVPTSERARAALYALDKTSNQAATAINSVNQAEDKLLGMSTGVVGGLLNVEGQFHGLTSAADRAGASFNGTNKASQALQTQFESNFVPSVQQEIDSMRTAGANSDQLAHVLSFMLGPAVDEGALKNKAFRDQIYLMAQEAGYHGVDTIKALTGWFDKNKTSAQQAAGAIKTLGSNIDSMKNKALSVTVTGQGTWNVQGLPGSISAHIHGGGHAQGAYIAHGAGPSVDDQFAMLARGELVVPEHMVRAGAVDHLRGHIPGFRKMATGGIVAGDYSGIATTWPTTQYNATLEAMAKSVADEIKKALTFVGPGGLGRASLRQIEDWWMGAGGPGGMIAHIAAAITGAESSFDPHAVQQGQPYATTGWGLWQITPGDSEPQFGINQALLNPVNNAGAAVAKYRQAGGSFSPWTTYVDGAYLRYMSQGGLVGRSYANGGVISEPVLGLGLHSGSPYTFGENGPEVVTPNMDNYSHGAGGDTYILNVSGDFTNPDATALRIVQALRDFKRHKGNQPLGIA